MNQPKSECCEACEKWTDDKGRHCIMIPFCKNLSCPCHLPPKNEWKCKNPDHKDGCPEVIDLPPKPESWEERFRESYRKIHSFEDSMYGEENQRHCANYIQLLRQTLADEKGKMREKILDAFNNAQFREINPHEILETHQARRHGFNQAKKRFLSDVLSILKQDDE